MKGKPNPYSEPVDTERYSYLKLVNGKIQHKKERFLIPERERNKGITFLEKRDKSGENQKSLLLLAEEGFL